MHMAKLSRFKDYVLKAKTFFFRLINRGIKVWRHKRLMKHVTIWILRCTKRYIHRCYLNHLKLRTLWWYFVIYRIPHRCQIKAFTFVWMIIAISWLIWKRLHLIKDNERVEVDIWIKKRRWSLRMEKLDCDNSVLYW